MTKPKRQQTLAVFRVDDIDEASAKGFEVEGKACFAIKKFGQIYIYRNRCPHMGLPLEWAADQFLDRGKELIICSTHGALFTIDKGRCVAGPCQNKHLVPVPYKIKNDTVMVSVPED